QMLFNRPPGFVLPGVGDGPSPELVSTSEWNAFMLAAGQACSTLGLRPGAESTWLSGLDPSRIDAASIRRLVEAQRALLGATIRMDSPRDRFWASYPFSVVVVDGSAGANRGQVQAV